MSDSIALPRWLSALPPGQSLPRQLLRRLTPLMEATWACSCEHRRGVGPDGVRGMRVLIKVFTKCYICEHLDITTLHRFLALRRQRSFT